jgi:TatD DNase family protein
MDRLPLFDTHAHLDTEEFAADRDSLIREIGESMLGFINPGCDVESSRAALKLAHTYPFVFAAVGLHPEDIGHCRREDLQVIEAWARDERVVAIGEIGLDYYNDEESPHEDQRFYLVEQLKMARRLDLPVIIHDREAHADMMDILLSEGKGVRGVLHCFSGDWAMAETMLEAGWYFGFGGTSTFKNDHGVREILKKMPQDRILFETDSPYMAPVPFRGRRNNPLLTARVAEKAAEVRGIPVETMMAIATKNSKILFPKLKIDEKMV